MDYPASTSPTKENHSPFDVDSKRASLSLMSPTPTNGMPRPRSPLSWQRRPLSQASDRPRSRPLSVMAAENAAARSSTRSPDQSPTAEQPFSRDEMAQSLAGKDPSGFRQTADRGQNSAAYRKNQVEDQNSLDLASLRAQLPGMSRDPPTDVPRPASPSSRPSSRPSSPAVHGKLASPLSLTPAQRFEPLSTGFGADSPADYATHDGSDGRTSPTRPGSPTKGMGGFVQSAMMKRTDSVKRWSVTSSPGLQRADSAASNRQSTENVSRTTTPTTASRPSSTLRGDPARPNAEHDTAAAPCIEITATDGQDHDDAGKITPPASPSKTMDPRRWSPNKASSWLDAALSKQESPKPKPIPPPANNQPAWMVELNKAKAQRGTGGSVDLGRNLSVSSRKHEVKTGGLMRSTPMGAAAKSAAGLVGMPSIPTNEKSAVSGFRGNLSNSAARRASEDAQVEAHVENTQKWGSGGSVGIATKANQDTPPKNDFRTNLKPRAPPPDSGNGQSKDELKNVLGSLRRTRTQNYVAPDTLKSNILQGKSALSLTGGPKKTERVDELKEAILKKKDDIKKAHSLESSLKSPDINRLSQASTDSRQESADVAPRVAPVSALEPSPMLDKTGSVRSPRLVSPISSELPARMAGKMGGGLADRFNPALAGLLARGPPGTGAASTGRAAAPTTSAAGSVGPSEPTGPGPQLTHITKGRARGPKRKAPSSVAKPVEESTVVKAAPTTPSLGLTPEAGSPKGSEEPAVTDSPRPIRPTTSPKPQVLPPVKGQSTFTAERPKPSGQKAPVDASTNQRFDEQESPATTDSFQEPRSPRKTRPRSPTKVHEQVAALAARNESSSKQQEPISQPSSPKKLATKRMSRFLEEPAPSSPKPGPEKSRPSSPVQKPRDWPEPLSLSPKKQRFGEAEKKADAEPVVPITKGLSLFSGFSFGAKAAAPAPVTPLPPSQDVPAASSERPRSPPKGARPLPIPRSTTGKAYTEIATPMRSPTKYGLELSSVFTEFFGPERPKRDYKVDAAEVLMNRPSPGPRIRTQQAQLFQVSGDGKKLPVPAHHERVLFEREMYLCPHTFETGAGKKVTEVYFWVGDEVPEPTADEAQVFVQREAKSFGGRLVKLTQGKESPEFLQALGGIVIVRRGTSKKYDSLAPNMLCGRRYLGQVVFDEVDFAPSSLCSGFPYLITQQGKCYLWKGKGSDVEELGCARLIGMDQALMGELTEVEEGDEPESFWHMFDGGAKASSADHWRLKPNYDKYCGRLFWSKPAGKQQVSPWLSCPDPPFPRPCSAAHRGETLTKPSTQMVEMSPYSQTDLLPSNIYVLDAFFELYIVVGARSQHQYAAFRNALDFAQEYAILAAGMEDRPFVPISTVVLEGIPRDLKSVFRKWRDDASPTVMNPNNPTTPNLKRGRSLRIVPLNQALQALTE